MRQGQRRQRQGQRQVQQQEQQQVQQQVQQQQQQQVQVQNYITNVIRRGKKTDSDDLRDKASEHITSNENSDSDSVLTLKLPKIINILQKIQEPGENVTGNVNPIDALKQIVYWMNRNLIISTWTPATDIINIMNGETPFKLVINESSIPDEEEVERIVLLASSIPYFRYGKQDDDMGVRDMGVTHVSQTISVDRSVFDQIVSFKNIYNLEDNVECLKKQSPTVKLWFIKRVLEHFKYYPLYDDEEPPINVGPPIDLNRITNKVETDKCPICLEGFESLKPHGVFTCCKNLCHTECYESLQTNTMGAVSCPFCRKQPFYFKNISDEQSTNSEEQSNSVNRLARRQHLALQKEIGTGNPWAPHHTATPPAVACSLGGKRSHHRRKPKRRSNTKHSQKPRLQRVAHQTPTNRRKTRRRRTYLGGGRRRKSIRF